MQDTPEGFDPIPSVPDVLVAPRTPSRRTGAAMPPKAVHPSAPDVCRTYIAASSFLLGLIQGSCVKKAVRTYTLTRSLCPRLAQTIRLLRSATLNATTVF